MINEFLAFDFTQAGLWTNILTGSYSRAYYFNCNYIVLDVMHANPLVKLLNCLAIREISGNDYIHAVKYQNGHYYFLLTRLKPVRDSDIFNRWDCNQVTVIDKYLSKYYMMDSFKADRHKGNYGKLGKQVICFDAYCPSGMSYQTHKFNMREIIVSLCAEYNIPKIGL